MASRRFSTWLLALLAAGTLPNALPSARGGSAHADEAPPRELLRLSLVEAMRLAVQNDLDLAESRFDLPIAHQRWIEADAGFDRLLVFGSELRRSETPSTNAFFATDEVRTDSGSVYARVGRRLRQGGEVSLLYRADRFDTNQAFTTANPAWQHGISGEIRLPLGRGRGRVAESEVRRRQSAMSGARAGEAAVVERVLLAAAEAYWALAFAQRDVDARLASEVVSRELLEDVEARIEAELATPLDSAEARAGLEARRSERLRAEAVRESAVDVLLRLVQPFRGGVEPPEVVAIDDPEAPSPYLQDAPVGVWVGEALARRPELVALRADAATKSIDLLEAHDGLQPAIDLVGTMGTLGYRRSLGSSFFDAAAGDALSASIGVEVSLYLDRRGEKARWRAAGWARHQATIRLAAAQSEIVAAVREHRRALDTAKALRDAARAQEAAAEEALQGERERLREGTSTPFRVLEKEELSTAARNDASRAAVDARLAEVRLAWAAGRLGELHGVSGPQYPSCASGTRCFRR